MTLEELIPLYASEKSEMDTLKKGVELKNTQIKDLMLKDKLDKVEAGGYQATCNVTERETLNVDKLLIILQNHNVNIEGLIKTKEYVDTDVLEDALYKDMIPEEVIVEMDSCREVKEVVTLRVAKIKPKKED